LLTLRLSLSRCSNQKNERRRDLGGLQQSDALCPRKKGVYPICGFEVFTAVTTVKVNRRLASPAACLLVVSCFAHSSTTKMEAVCSADTSLKSYWTARNHMSESSPLHISLPPSQSLLFKFVPSPASHRGGPGPSPGQIMWDLWWTKWFWGTFSPITSVSPANSHSTDCSTLIIIYHLRLVQYAKLRGD
jgi:hypothetical protein